MKIQVQDNQKEYEIELGQVTQICGHNFQLKNYIINSLIKFFSNSKYMEYEEKMIDNVKINGNEVGRKYFKCFIIENRKDLLELIKISKAGFMLKYITDITNSFDTQKNIIQIEDNFQEIFNLVNSILHKKIGNIEIEYEQKDVFDLLKDLKIKGDNENYIEEKNNCELISYLLNLINEIQINSPEKILVIFNNMDHLINVAEYKEIINQVDEVKKKSDIWFIFTLSIDNYVEIDEEKITSITVINDLIYTLPSLERIRDYIIKKYPCNVDNATSNGEILRLLKSIIQTIGSENDSIDMKSAVLLKMINESLCIKTPVYSLLNNLENNYLESKM